MESSPSVPTGVRVAGGAAGAFVAVCAGLLAGWGWLYVLRGLHWLGVGPRVSDSLPLLQLAASDGQPLLRLVVAWLLGGALAGAALLRMKPMVRATVALVLGLPLLLLASQAAYAVTRNLALSDVVFSRRPGAGPVVEGCAFAAGVVLIGLVGSLSDRQRLVAGLAARRLPRLARLHDRRLRRS